MIPVYEIAVGEPYKPQGIYARTRKQRRKGLSHQDLSGSGPMVFEKCRSIHTFGMRFDLLVVFLDVNNIVVRVKYMIPNRLAWGPRGTHTIVELPVD